jgi:putative NADH-flavin reductase
MRLTVFGATGGTGRSVITQALAVGDKVTVLARDPGALAEFGDRITIVGGDVLDPKAVDTAVDGADAVISALGIGMHRHATTVYSQGTANIIGAMRAQRVSRLLVVSTTSLEIPSPRQLFEWLLAKVLLHNILAKPYADMAVMEQHVRECGLDWTLVRAARLTNGPLTGHYRSSVNRKLRGCWSISRADVAHHLLTHVADAESSQAVVEIAY